MKSTQKQGGATTPLVLFLVFISLVLIIVFTSFGSVKIDAKDVLLSLIGRQENQIYKNLILNIRLPRVIGTFLVGAILAVSGNVLQLLVQIPPWQIHICLEFLLELVLVQYYTQH